ncbi:phage antirepressor N-terminal domain-containing protein [Snodgrassella alvi]|uniref:phage antirepressor N-terminal domain-containing protein n=1 Tax=Snodgrassella alvi TaxID=1196083 RepID=UPI001C0C132E|nr:phage antirepressor N-terminal domain-containing protein [Snodgrassella alvi]
MEYLNVNFLGSEIMVINHDGEPYVAMRTVVDGMGLSWNGQFVKIKQRFKSVVMEIITTGKDGKNYKMLCLPLRKLFGWLMTISPDKVASHKRQTIIRYQNECDDALWQYWTNGIANREKILQEMELLKKQQAESAARGSAAGKALNQRKLEKRQLEMQLDAINQLDLFKQMD